MATWPPILDDDGSGTTGTPTDYALFQQIKAYIDGQAGATVGDAWTNVPFNAGNFGAGGAMTWTVEAGDILMNRYKVNGKTLLWSAYLFTTTLGGTVSNQLRINLPVPGMQAATARFLMPVAFIGDGGANVTGYAETVGVTYLAINKTNLANFTLGANALHVAFTVLFEIA